MGFGDFIKAFQIMGTISSWSVKALEDGKVTLTEATELAEDVCKILGIPLELDVGVETKLDEEGPYLPDSTPDSEVVEETKIDEDARDLEGDKLDFNVD